MSHSRLFPSFLHIALVVFVLAAGSASPARANSPAAASAVAIPFADSFSWHGFVRYWKSFANRADHVVLVVLLVAATALFIITRGKWLK
jgi:hypothetical protein